MELLKRTFFGGRGATWICGALMLASAAGCMLLDKLGGREKRFAFSHALHVKDQGLECINCHQDAKRTDEPGMPALDGCLACHEEIDAKKPEEKRVVRLFEGETFKALHAGALASEVRFSHKLHARKQECSACHAAVETGSQVEKESGLAMDTCTRCHDAQAVDGRCATCHTQIDASWAPENHHHEWMKLHGGVVRADTGATADGCALCHSESTCVTCHKEEAPESHTNHFRLRGHGIASMMDRQTCAACHEPDSCDRCHRDTLPQNHTGLWGGTRSNHCVVCHFPLRAEGCVVCHADAPSHLSARPKPPDHTPVMICRQCHGITQALPHADKGDDCNACHH